MPFPLLFRVASLSVTELQSFSNEALANLVHKIAELREVAERKRVELANGLYNEIARRTELREKEALLKMKRSCAMNQPFTRQSAVTAGSALSALVCDIIHLEEGLTAAETRFNSQYAEAHERECAALQHTFTNADLICGISFSSESLVNQMLKYRATGSSEPRKLRRMELAWLGFLSRAVTKPSPFSTLTRVGLGLAEQSDRLCMAPGPWQQHSVVRVKRYIIDQCFQQLLGDSAFISSLQLELNFTLKSIAENQYRFFVPGKWRPGSSRQYEFKLEAIGKVRLSAEMIGFLERWFADGRRSFVETLAMAEHELKFENAGSAESLLRQLISAGIVLVFTPWHTNAASLESELLSYLETLPEEKFTRIADELRDLCHLEERCTTHPHEAPQLTRDVTRKVDGVWSAIQVILPESEHARFTMTKMLIKHDLFVSASTPLGEIGRTSVPLITSANESLRPLAEATSIFWAGFDFLLSAAAAAGLGNDCHALPLEEFLERTRTLWREFTAYVLRKRKGDLLREPFNPFHLESVARLHEARIRIRDEMKEIVFVNAAGEAEINISMLRRIIQEHMPVWHKPVLAPCVFMQPTDGTMKRWVYNQSSDGTARLSSRFVHLMPRDMQQAYLEHVRACSRWIRNGRRVELLDVSTIQGEMLNVHPVQTTFVLRMPGDDYDLPEAHQLRFTDLTVVLDEESGLPWLMGPGGMQLLPVQLGGVGHDFISSSTVRQISVLGPPTQLPYIPDALKTESDGVSEASRLVIGNLVLRRKSWSVPCSTLPQAKSTGVDADFYLAMNQWRKQAGIPAKCYAKLDIEFDAVTSRHKPQFIDFSSTLFLRTLASMMQNHTGNVEFDEAMPMPEPGDPAGGEPYVYEVLSDPLLYRVEFQPAENTGEAPAPDLPLQSAGPAYAEHEGFS